MLRLTQISNSLPSSWICDPSAEFQPGTVAQLVVMGNQIVCTVSNGTAPLGIIDDIKTRAFTNVSWNEEIRVPALGVNGPNNTLVTPVDIKWELKKPNVISKSFSSTVEVLLNPVNGIITFPAGTQLNVDLIGSGIPNGIRTIVNYTYYIANIPGDDSTAGTGRVTVWHDRLFAQTNVFETNMSYPLNAPLYVSEIGVLTTRKPSERHPSIAIVTGPPSSLSAYLDFFWL